jgi:hypothetical protein
MRLGRCGEERSLASARNRTVAMQAFSLPTELPDTVLSMDRTKLIASAEFLTQQFVAVEQVGQMVLCLGGFHDCLRVLGHLVLNAVLLCEVVVIRVVEPIVDCKQKTVSS